MTGIVVHKRVIIGVVLMSLLTFLWYSQLFQRQKKELVRLADAIENVEMLTYSWVSETKSLSDYHSEYVTLEKEQHQILSEIPRANQVHELAQQLIEIGKNHGCKVTYVGIPFSQFFTGDDSEKSSQQGDVMVLPLQLIVSGDFVSVGHYIETLSTLPLFVAYGELEMSQVYSEGDELESNFSMYVYIKRAEGTKEGVS